MLFEIFVVIGFLIGISNTVGMTGLLIVDFKILAGTDSVYDNLVMSYIQFYLITEIVCLILMIPMFLMFISTVWEKNFLAVSICGLVSYFMIAIVFVIFDIFAFILQSEKTCNGMVDTYVLTINPITYPKETIYITKKNGIKAQSLHNFSTIASSFIYENCVLHSGKRWTYAFIMLPTYLMIALFPCLMCLPICLLD